MNPNRNEVKKMKAVVLAGGKGTRLVPYTKVIPKPLMPIGDMPIMEVLIRQMKQAGVEEVVLTVGHMAELLRAFFQNGERFDLPITYSFEEYPLGTAGPLSLIENLDDTFFVMNGDVLTTLPLQDLFRYHQEQKACATIAMHHRKIKIDLGVIRCNGHNEVVDYIEKPTQDYMVSMGIYVFDPCVLSYIPKWEKMDFPELIHQLLAAHEKVVGFPFDGYWQDLGRPDDYEQAIQDFDEMRSQFLPEV
jgi:NDP-sugar pyrophosphorylase family protein